MNLRTQRPSTLIFVRTLSQFTTSHCPEFAVKTVQQFDCTRLSIECYPLAREGELLADYSRVQVMRNDKHPHHAVVIHVQPHEYFTWHEEHADVRAEMRPSRTSSAC